MILADEKGEYNELEASLDSPSTLNLPPPYHSDPPALLPPPSPTPIPGRFPSSQSFKPSEPVPTPRHNFLSIQRTHETIRGHWIIDTSLPGPSYSSESSNVRFESRTGNIESSISLRGTSRAKIEAVTTSGSITLNMLEREAVPFHVKASSQKGSITVHVPRNFNGPIRWKSSRKPLFSPALHDRSLNISSSSENSRIGTLFIGALTRSGFDPNRPEEWVGDEIEVEESGGSLRLLYTDEQVGESTLEQAIKWTKRLFVWPNWVKMSSGSR